MSLDVSLIVKNPVKKKGTGVFVREKGTNRELTPQEVEKKFPDAAIRERQYETECVFTANITHNLGEMANAANIYHACWHPEEINATKASDILPLLEKGFEDMKARPDYFKKFDSPNGWGMYVDFLPWVEAYIIACKKYPNAIIKVNR